MFAFVFSQLPARLRRALALIKAFAFLEDPPPARQSRPSRTDIAVAPARPAGELSAACAGDRRRGPGAHRTPRPCSAVERCSTAGHGAGRSGRPVAPPQRCATPTTSGKRAAAPAAAQDRRASVPGGFLHR